MYSHTSFTTIQLYILAILHIYYKKSSYILYTAILVFTTQSEYTIAILDIYLRNSSYISYTANLDKYSSLDTPQHFEATGQKL